MNKNNLKNTLLAINEFAKRYQKNPDDYLIENDVQSILFHHIREKLPRKIELKNQDRTYILNQVYTEYHINRGKNAPKFDIVLLDENKMKNINFKDKMWSIYLPVFATIEIKCGYSLNPINKALNDAQNDLKKLKLSKIEKYISLVFYDEDINSELHLVSKNYKLKKVNSISSWQNAYIIAKDSIYQIKANI